MFRYWALDASETRRRDCPISFMPPPTSIAVLGGGISGLSAAFHLARRYPNVPLTLFESSDRLGGWIHTSHKTHPSIPGVYNVEHGPRTLRPSPALMELVRLLTNLDTKKLK